jgi:hypothetical protein
MTKNTRKASEWTNEEIAQDPSRYLAAQRAFAEDQEEARVARAEALKSYTEADVRACGNIRPASRRCSFFPSRSRWRLASSEMKDHHLPLLLGGISRSSMMVWFLKRYRRSTSLQRTGSSLRAPPSGRYGRLTASWIGYVLRSTDQLGVPGHRAPV